MYLGGYSSNQGSAGTAHSVTPYQGLKATLGTVDFLPGIVPGALVIYFVRHYIAKGFAMGRV